MKNEIIFLIALFIIAAVAVVVIRVKYSIELNRLLGRDIKDKNVVYRMVANHFLKDLQE